MNFSSPTRALLLIAALRLSTSAPGVLGQAIPPTPPTSPASWQPPAPAASAPQTATQTAAKTNAQQPARRAQIAFTANLLTVTADNSSLNQILRDIGRQTGMKITGGVTDERVFGTYGPADPSAVLTTLLKGTGSNMLLVFNDIQAPIELVLTPRGGGPSPPNPSSGRDGDQEDLPPQLMPRGPRLGVNGNAFPRSPAELPQFSPVPATAQTPPSSAPIPPAPGTTTQESPNGVKTPQQIYDQLMKMQQQQPKPPGSPPGL